MRDFLSLVFVFIIGCVIGWCACKESFVSVFSKYHFKFKTKEDITEAVFILEDEAGKVIYEKMFTGDEITTY